MGIASIKAVNAESWRGEMFLVENIMQDTGCWLLVAGC